MGSERVVRNPAPPFRGCHFRSAPASDGLYRMDCLFIENLRERSAFRETVVDRIWQTWSKAQGYPRSVAETPVNKSLAANANGLPLCLVAHDQEGFQGTIALIENDPEYPDQDGPWIDALWVEPAARGSGLARDLLQRAASAGRASGHKTLYLEALPSVRSFYAKQGWTFARPSASGTDLAVMRLALH